MPRLVVCVFFASLMMLRCSAIEQEEVRCPNPCPYNFDPVCGSDGTDTLMFANSCFMDRYNCETQREFLRVNDSDCMEQEFVDK